MPYLNLDIDYFAQPRTRAFMRILGRGSELLPLRLYAYAARYFIKDGRLKGVSIKMLEDECGWTGQPGEMVRAMLLPEISFLAADGNVLLVHDWPGMKFSNTPEEQKELPRQQRHRRRARLREVASTLTPAEWRSVLAWFNHACAYCLRGGVPLHIDHVKAISRGGADVSENVVPACKSCNCRKHAKSVLEFVTGFKFSRGK